MVTGWSSGWWNAQMPDTYWYEYPSGWWNTWFWDDPWDPTQAKTIRVIVWAWATGPDPMLYFVVNWSTYDWTLLGFGPDWPPIPDVPGVPQPIDEELYIVREEFPIVIGPDHENREKNGYWVWIPDYNPEWVSIDIMGQNVVIEGWIRHECVDPSPVLNETWGSIKALYHQTSAGPRWGSRSELSWTRPRPEGRGLAPSETPPGRPMSHGETRPQT